MQITTKFDMGQTVYKITQDRGKRWEPCGFCAASGRVAGADGSLRKCPECYGRRGEEVYEDVGWRVEDYPLTIGQVRVKITESPGIDGEEIFDNYKAQSGREEQYMATETGIGSGTLHPVEKLFATRDEAVAECETRNAEALAPPTDPKEQQA